MPPLKGIFKGPFGAPAPKPRLKMIGLQGRDGLLQDLDEVAWVAVKEPKSSDHKSETLLVGLCAYYGILTQVP